MTNSTFIAAIEPVLVQLALKISWRDGTVNQVDLTEHLRRFTVLTPPYDLGFFAQVSVGEWAFDVE